MIYPCRYGMINAVWNSGHRQTGSWTRRCEDGKMKEIKEILVTVPVNSRQKAFLEQQAEGGNYDCRFHYCGFGSVTADVIRPVHYLIGGCEKQVLREAENLQWIQIMFAGLDYFIDPAVVPEQVLITNAAGAYGLTVGEHMIGMTFALVRRFPEYAYQQHNGPVWAPVGNVTSVEGSTVLVLGMGDIGSFYARKMKALGAYVIGVRRTLRALPEGFDEQHTLEELDSLLGRADIVASVLPGIPETQGLFGAKQFSEMKDGAYFINTGRGGAVDTAALRDALKSGKIGGAALDVTDPEPLPLTDELWTMKNVMITPHVAGNLYLAETTERIIRIAGENLRRMTHGETVVRPIDRRLGY